MKIEYDEYLGLWVVWQKDGSTYTCLFESKNKTDCQKFVEKRKKKRGKKK